MLPAVWGAWKGASLAWKAGTAAAIVLIPLLCYHIGHWRGVATGEQRCEDRHTTIALKQADAVATHTAKQATLPVSVIEGLLREQQENEHIKATLTKQLAAYQRAREQRTEIPTKELPHATPSCRNYDPLDREFIERWDTISRLLLEETGSADALPATDRDPEGAVGVPTEDLSTATLLRARQAELEDVKTTRDYYNALREFSKGVYILQKSWRENQQEAQTP